MTLPDPKRIQHIASTSKSLTIEWEPYTRAKHYIMMCRPVGSDESIVEIILDSIHKTEINNTNVQRNGKKLTVLNLHPKTQYQFWLSFQFENRSEPYNWPRDERFVFETHADRPNPPGTPLIINVQGEVYQVTWTAAEGNGAVVDEYSLEGVRYQISRRPTRSTNSTDTNNQTLATNVLSVPLIVDDPIPIADEWREYYRGNDTYWIIKGLPDALSQYTFRVRARNAHGWSEYSSPSERTTDIFTFEHREYLLTAVVAPALVTIVIVAFSCIYCGKCRSSTIKFGN